MRFFDIEELVEAINGPSAQEAEVTAGQYIAAGIAPSWREYEPAEHFEDDAEPHVLELIEAGARFDRAKAVAHAKAIIDEEYQS